MNRIKDITGKKFNMLTAIRCVETNEQGNSMWLFRCDCGKEKVIRGVNVTSGKTKSCGCYRPPKKKDMIGKRFGKWTVIELGVNPHKNTGNRHVYWRCQCDCGTIKDVDGISLRTGQSTSCGCIRSKTEVLIADILREHNINFKTQYTFNDLRGKRNNYLRFDFGILDNNNQLLGLIEFQGELHEQPYNKRNDGSFQRQLECDQMKRNYCYNNNIPLIEINYRERELINWEYLNVIIQSLSNKKRGN